MQISDTSTKTHEQQHADPYGRQKSLNGYRATAVAGTLSLAGKAKPGRSSRDNFDTDFEEMFDNMPV